MARLAALAFFIVAVLGPLLAPFMTRVHALTLCIGGVVALLPALQASSVKLTRPLRLAALLLLGLLMMGLFFSPQLERALKDVAYLLTALAAACILWRADQAGKLKGGWLVVGWLGLTAFVVIEYVSSLALNRTLNSWLGEAAPLPYELDRAIVAATLLLWPLLAWISGRMGAGLAILLLCVVIVPVSFTMSQASLLGLSAGLATMVAGLLFPAMVRWLLPLAAAGIILLMPALALWGASNLHGTGELWAAANSASRLHIWAVVSAEVLQSPLWGHGIEAARDIPFIAENNFAHPHNGTLQLWLEFGALGALAFAALIFSIARKSSQLSPAYRALAQGALVCWLGIFCVSYNIWQAWWIALTLITLVLFIQRTRH
jgi:O-antigen ligase